MFHTLRHKKFEKVEFGAIGITASEIVQHGHMHKGCKLGHRLSDEVSKMWTTMETTEHMRQTQDLLIYAWFKSSLDIGLLYGTSRHTCLQTSNYPVSFKIIGTPAFDHSAHH